MRSMASETFLAFLDDLFRRANALLKQKKKRARVTESRLMFRCFFFLLFFLPQRTQVPPRVPAETESVNVCDLCVTVVCYSMQTFPVALMLSGGRWGGEIKKNWSAKK